MDLEIKNQCYLLSLEGYQGKEIAKKLNIAESTVSKALKSVTTGNDYQLAIKGCSVLLQEFVKFQDFCRVKLKELSELKEESKVVTKNNNESGQIEAIEIPLSPIEKMAIIKTQTEIYKELLTLGAQGEFIQGVQKIRGAVAQLEQAK